MNPRQLRNLGVPEGALNIALECIQNAIGKGGLAGKDVKERVRLILESPNAFLNDTHFAPFAQALTIEPVSETCEPIEYRTWGKEIDQASHDQMKQACSLPPARGAALMPDAHVGYGLPIGGVLALENAVCPYAVGVDIACRMKLSVLDMPVETLDTRYEHYRQAVQRGTRFGVGAVHEKPQDHPVMDEDWTITRITREHKDKAHKQLGTSGSGNHFVEFGTLTVDGRIPELDLDPGKYVALLSHSGSRGSGAAVCDTYSRIARARLPQKYADFGRLAWMSLDSEEGQEYWAAMNLMGDYAAANHDVIHRLVSKLLGARIITGVENHHNFAWKEVHNGRELIVHRKGATPAGEGVLGVIPGSMASPAYVVRGLGNPESLNSASHGAGRRMSRTQAKSMFSFRAVQRDLEQKGIRILSAGADEVPSVYKDIESVMAEQRDLVQAIARFDPRIVKMSDDGKAED
jgi:tRNA-splicing ligase RtcB